MDKYNFSSLRTTATDFWSLCQNITKLTSVCFDINFETEMLFVLKALTLA